MEIGVTTKHPGTKNPALDIRLALLSKAWRESRGRFFSALLLLPALVFYAILTSGDYISRYNSLHPQEPLVYSVYIWSGLFNYALQGLWILAALVLGFGGLARESATGAALFTLGLPVRRLHLFLARAAMALTEAMVLAVVSALLIPAISSFAGKPYPPLQALLFGLSMGTAGLVFVNFGLFLSELFEAEFTAPVVGLCSITTVFLSYKAHRPGGWNVFDVMSAAESINPTTQLLTGSGHWIGLGISLLISLGLLLASTSVIRARDF
jgi:ABC-type transport system involved in multi-copper enzyme maturation permease subunit